MAKKKKTQADRTQNGPTQTSRASMRRCWSSPSPRRLEINYMPYAMSGHHQSRAIPEIDGFKPSHRKLLYTMYQMKLLGGHAHQERQRGGRRP